MQLVNLNVFGDTSRTGASVAVYAIVKQKHGSNHGLLVCKSRLSKKDLSVPRLELVAANVNVNNLENTTAALHRYQIKSCYGWSDSMMFLYRLEDMKTTNNWYPTKWKKSLRNVLHAGDMLHLLKTLQSWETRNVKEDQSQYCEMVSSGWWIL